MMLTKKITPSKSLIIKPMPCEKQTAYLQNCAVDEAAKGRVDMVTYHYLQTRQGQTNTRNEAFIHGLIGIGTLMYVLHLKNNFLANKSLHDRDYLFIETMIGTLFSFVLFIFLPACLANIPPNLSNTSRHRDTKDECKQWLIGHKGIAFFQEVDKLPFTPFGLRRLLELLKEKDIDCSSLENKLVARIKKLEERDIMGWSL
jgi:hypothetical protein